MPLTPLAAAIYEILRIRVPAVAPEMTYRELVEALPPLGVPYENLHWRDPRLDDALGELVAACRAAQPPLPAISAIVVNGETSQPGQRYYPVAHPGVQGEMERIVAWGNERNAVAGQTYPPAF